jgi:uncharacterized protein YlxP (DUF503 family)
MIVGIAVLELHLPHARSLKEKRQVVRSLIDRMHARYRVSVAETAHHDLHQRAEIGIAAVGRSEREVDELLATLRRLVDDEPAALVVQWLPQLLEEAP